MLENQAAYMEGRESDVYSLLLRVRYRNRTNVREESVFWSHYLIPVFVDS